MKQKRMVSMFLVLALLFALVPATVAAREASIGIAMPVAAADSAQSWARHGEYLQSELEKLGYDVHLTYADGASQDAQIDELVARGVQVLVVCLDDPSAFGPELDRAADAGVKLLAYDRMPVNTEGVDALVAFDSRQAGRLQAEYAVKRLAADGKLTASKPAVIDILGGDRADPNALRLAEGALEVLAPYVQAGMVADPGTAQSLLTDGPTAAAGKARMQALLAAGHRPDALLCGSDALLLGALEAMDAVEGLPNSYCVGRGATAAIASKIAQGPYPMASVLQDARLLAQRAAQVADALARGAALPKADAAISNGKREIETYVTQPQLVWSSNYRALLIDGGYYTAAALGVGPTAPVTAGEALSSLMMWDQTHVTDVEKRGRELGILSTGAGDKMVGMDTVLSRGGAAAIVQTYCQKTGLLPQASAALAFQDAAAAKPQFVEGLAFCVAHGILRGTENKLLASTRPLTRQEWDIMLGRLAMKRDELARNDPETAYARAVADAVTVEPEELLPLKTTITKTDPNVTWNAAGDKVLVMTWNRHPERYTDGAVRTVETDPVWVFTDQELTNWYAANADSITDLDLRLEQLIGLPPEAGYTTMTALWVAPDRLLRPAYDTDITTATMGTTLAGDADYQRWFEENTAYSYGEGSYPWTRLGYTYDWADNGTEYGLTEFIIETGSQVEVEFSQPTADYFAALAATLRAG